MLLLQSGRKHGVVGLRHRVELGKGAIREDACRHDAAHAADALGLESGLARVGIAGARQGDRERAAGPRLEHAGPQGAKAGDRVLEQRHRALAFTNRTESLEQLGHVIVQLVSSRVMCRSRSAVADHGVCERKRRAREPCQPERSSGLGLLRRAGRLGHAGAVRREEMGDRQAELSPSRDGRVRLEVLERAREQRRRLTTVACEERRKPAHRQTLRCPEPSGLLAREAWVADRR